MLVFYKQIKRTGFYHTNPSYWSLPNKSNILVSAIQIRHIGLYQTNPTYWFLPYKSIILVFTKQIQHTGFCHTNPLCWLWSLPTRYHDGLYQTNLILLSFTTTTTKNAIYGFCQANPIFTKQIQHTGFCHTNPSYWSLPNKSNILVSAIQIHHIGLYQTNPTYWFLPYKSFMLALVFTNQIP